MARQNVPGIARKPDYCGSACPLAQRGNGFVADHVGRKPLIAFLQPTPTKADALARQPMMSYKGLFYYTVLKPLGLTMDNVIISHILRCDNWKYPTAAERKRAEVACRAFDTVSRDSQGEPNVATGLRTWDPNFFVLTFTMADARTLEAYQALMMADIAKALRFANSGFRPLVLQGKESMELLAPWLQGLGGLKKWRGDWWEGSLPWPLTKAPVAKYDRNLVAVETIVTPKRKAPAQQLGFNFE